MIESILLQLVSKQRGVNTRISKSTQIYYDKNTDELCVKILARKSKTYKFGYEKVANMLNAFLLSDVCEDFIEQIRALD